MTVLFIQIFRLNIFVTESQSINHTSHRNENHFTQRNRIPLHSEMILLQHDSKIILGLIHKNLTLNNILILLGILLSKQFKK